MTETQMVEGLRKFDREYELGTPSISDFEYDAFKTGFRLLYPDNSYNNIVGASVDGQKVELPFILGSLTKVKSDGTCQNFLSEVSGDKVYWAKLDGVSALVQYVDGEYNRALTRGDGTYGTDITTKLVQAVPQKLNKPVTGSYRAEVMLVGDVYKDLGYKTRRNGVAGILNRDGEEQCEHLVVLFYELVEQIGFNPEFNDEMTRIWQMEELGLPLAPSVVDDEKTDEQLVTLLRKWKEENNYDIDGVVIVRNDSQREDTYYPDDKVAFKVNEDATICNVVGVTWQVGRTGRVIPVVNIDPTEIGGVTVSNSTGFNAKFVIDNGIDIGARVGIYRSGDVIPYIDFVLESVEITDKNKSCPSCGSLLQWKGVDLVCVAPVCEDRDTQVVEHFLTKLGCENVTAVTLKKLGVTTLKEVYDLDEIEISQLSGFGIRRAQQIIFEINKTLKTTPDKLLSSFGMTGIGDRASKSILKGYDFVDIWTLTEEDLVKIDGIGQILAKNFVEQIGEFKVIYEILVENGLEWSSSTNNLSGKSFCLTGSSDIKRDVLKKMIDSNGGSVNGMSKKIDYLVTNDPTNMSGKTKKAMDYGVPIISYVDLMEMLG